MEERELELLAAKAAEVAEKRADERAAVKAAKDAEIKAAVEAGIEEYKNTQEPAWKGGFATKKVTKLGLKDDEMASFLHYIRTGDSVAAKAAMVEGTDSYGGFLVPEDFHATIQAKVNELAWPRRAGVQILNGSRDVMQVPREGTSLTKWEVTAESCDYYEEEPQLDPLSLTAYKWTRLIKLSEELVEDQAANLDEFLSNTIADWAAQTESYMCAVGSGSGQHTGVACWTSTTTLVANTTLATSDVITVAEIFALAYSLNDGLRDRAVWLTNGTTESYIRQLLVSTPYAFGPPSLQGTGTGMGGIFGRPMFNSSGMSAYNSGESDTVVLAFFDPKAYMIYERKGLAIRRLNELYAANGQVGLIASFRQTGGIAIPAHVKHLCNKDAT